MSKRKRKRQGHPARISPLRSIAPPDARPPDPAPLEQRPEYVANMQAWREAGCPQPGSAPTLS